MYRPASRLIARAPALRTQLPRVAPPNRRFLSTAPPAQKSRSWKSLVARLGLAGAIIYYYNTTDVFAEEPRQVVQHPPETENETEQLQTIDALAQERQKRKAAAAESSADAAAAQGGEGGMEGLEEEADQQGAFNPETGEINWDCPCLGGMADGPCGEDFKAAFSCFVFSQEEPKGMDCIDKFKGMQTCFRQYPEIYGSELEPEDEDDVTAGGNDAGLAPADATSGTPPAGPSSTESHDAEKVGAAALTDPSQPSSAERQARQKRAEQAKEQVRQEQGVPLQELVKSNETKETGTPKEDLSESDKVVPKSWHDETGANEKAKKE